jgi:enoyl-CoA hydratase/carnithine racemase
MLLRLNRPKQLNALDHPLRMAVADALARAQADEGVRAIVLTGAGERAFCAGQDLNESAALGPGDGPAWMESWLRYFGAFSTTTKPLIAAVNGVAAGAGFETALLCDIRISVADARFIMAEIDIGLPAIVGGHLVKLHLGLSRAVDIVLSGRAVTAGEARDMGLVHEVVVAPGELEVRALAMARELAAKPRIAMRLDIERFREVAGAGLAAARAASARYQAEAIATGEPQEAMRRFFERRAARRTG